ncbi:hypothetical protein FVE85_4704 [Porphyridium purpureum]|uniref:Uncharacterized protein n=1 Tax=Porphyridium purpureum TaxID=35688 RepID=A0A5J4YT04_PORPP|nr:hypothetical protein FVE85_4704 [Porphyridium purpureum]|eukprot:POR3746..scf236_6
MSEPTISRETLSTHSTVSKFAGAEDFPCLFRTSQCPDSCGHGGLVAVFQVDEYLAYNKLGQYGDEKQDKFHIKVSKLDDTVRGIYAQLKPGDEVLLDWKHDYVTRTTYSGGKDFTSKSPERPITKLKKK